MPRHAAMADVSDQQTNSDLQRCMCCDKIVENLSDDTISIGLNLKLGLVSDECALIWNDCTGRLVEARKLQARPSNGRKTRRKEGRSE
jgi:hypothetical protein